MAISVTRLQHRIVPDPRRVMSRFFLPGGDERAGKIIGRLLEMEEGQVVDLLAQLEAEFGRKHRSVREVWRRHFDNVRHTVPAGASLSEARQLLAGAYFTMEYSLESAALFNPSMVPAWNQEGLPEGSTRFTMSLRATGEGHVSSIVFRRGLIDKDCNIVIETRNPYAIPLKKVATPSCDRELWRQSLIAADALSPEATMVLNRLGEMFTPEEMNRAIDEVRAQLGGAGELQEAHQNLMAVAYGNFDLELDGTEEMSELVIFPNSRIESGGIEDLRLVRFVDDDGKVRYYGTYTAYNRYSIFPQLTEHDGGPLLKVRTLMGRGARNKGMALFPRKIDGQYVMVSRSDNENLFLMRSDNVLFWDKAVPLQQPRYHWQFVQIGNCGSPLETEDGWLLLTHGVGPMRQYCIGASLLDLDDPSKLIGQTREPLLVPNEEESAGYVPNVVYSCGGMIHNGLLVIPYAMSDVATSFATVDLGELLDELKRGA